MPTSDLVDAECEKALGGAADDETGPIAVIPEVGGAERAET